MQQVIIVEKDRLIRISDVRIVEKDFETLQNIDGTENVQNITEKNYQSRKQW